MRSKLFWACHIGMSTKPASAVYEYTIGAAVYDCVTLRVATKFLTSLDHATKSMENLCLVAALLLTMASITGSSAVGEKLPFVDEQKAEMIYIGLSFVGLSGFFLSTLSGASTLVFCSFLSSDAEFLAYVSHCAYLWKVTLGAFFVGLFSYVLSQFWLLGSLLEPTAALSLAAPGIATLCVVLFGFAHSTQVCTQIRETLVKAELES